MSSKNIGKDEICVAHCKFRRSIEKSVAEEEPSPPELVPGGYLQGEIQAKTISNLKNLVLTEHECIGPKLTHAEGCILGVGAKMFTIAGPVMV